MMIFKRLILFLSFMSLLIGCTQRNPISQVKGCKSYEKDGMYYSRFYLDNKITELQTRGTKDLLPSNRLVEESEILFDGNYELAQKLEFPDETVWTGIIQLLSYRGEDVNETLIGIFRSDAENSDFPEHLAIGNYFILHEHNGKIFSAYNENVGHDSVGKVAILYQSKANGIKRWKLLEEVEFLSSELSKIEIVNDQIIVSGISYVLGGAFAKKLEGEYLNCAE